MRRIWMLLFVLVLTVVVMAVPALAAGHDHGTCIVQTGTCSECGVAHGEGWKSLSEVTGNEIPEGKYYVPDGGIAKNFQVTQGQTVTICLNGQEWSGKGSSRPLRIAGVDTTVNIVDCSARTDYISAGSINGVTMTNDGGTINISEKTTLYFYNGVIVGGSAKNGGAMNVQQTANGKPTVYFICGKIIGGTASTNGGAVAVQAGATFYMGNEKTAKVGVGGRSIPVIEGGSAANGNGGSVLANGGSFYMKSGTISGGSAKNGGSVYATSGTFNMSQGLIDGGNATGNGGNIYLATGGTFRMSEGLVENGSVNGSSENTSANLYTNSGTLDMTGGQISGYVHILTYQASDDCKVLVKLSGTAKIVMKNANGDAIGGLYYQIGKSADYWRGIMPLRVGNFESGAEIYVGVVAADTFVDGVSTCLIKKDETAGAAYENFMKKDVTGDGQVTWADYEDALRYIHLYSSGSAISYEKDGIYLRSTQNGEIYHCVCCGDPHIGDCDGFDKCWVPYTINDGDLLPTTVTGGNYIYLVEGGDNGDGTIRGNSTMSQYNSAINLYVDMNGLTYYSGRRIVRFDVADVNVTFTNSKSSGGFEFDNGFGAANIRYDGFATKTGSTLNFYRVNIDAEKYSPMGTFISVTSGECNFYNSTIKCASPINNGNNLGYGGLATVGAAGSLKMVGCTVTGGSVTGDGGVLYLSNSASRAVLTDCTITGGAAAGNGGVIYTYGDLTLNNCAISGGAATDGNNLYIFTNSNVTINGGFVDGGVRIAGTNPTLRLSGAVKINNGGTASNSGIYLVPATNFYVSGVTADADILLYLASPGEKKTGWCVAVEDGLVLDAFNLVNNNLYLVNAENTLGYVGNTKDHAALRNRVLYSASEAALAGAKNGDFVKLFAGAENATVNANITLDLNGQTVTNLGVAVDKKISLFDSTGSSYGAPTGSVTLAAGTTADNFNREMLTGGVTDKNMRYVTVKVGDQVSAHRIYLSIKSVSLVARENPGLGFRTVLRCDEDLAKLLVYGAAVRFVNSDKVACSIYTNIDAWDSENQTENSKLSGLLFDIENSQLTDNVSTKLVANAYLIINDDFADYDEVTDETGAKIAIQNGQSNALRSSTSMSVSLQDAVEATDVMYDDLADNLINGLTKMINKWQAVMNGWNIPNIKKLIDVTE